jgi:general secretion pathway protein J
VTGRTRSDGFTLLELLVAVAVFAVFGLLAFGGLIRFVRFNESLVAYEERLTQVQYGMRRMTHDLHQLQPRPVRDVLGTPVPSLMAGAGSEFPVEFTRGGWSNTLGGPRGTLQRVAYLNDNGTLVRLHWLVLDRTPSNQPVRTELMDGVEQMTMRFMDAAGQWQTDWPPVESGDDPAAALLARPRGVEVSVVLEDWGTIRRLVELSP